MGSTALSSDMTRPVDSGSEAAFVSVGEAWAGECEADSCVASSSPATSDGLTLVAGSLCAGSGMVAIVSEATVSIVFEERRGDRRAKWTGREERELVARTFARGTLQNSGRAIGHAKKNARESYKTAWLIQQYVGRSTER